MTFCSNCSQFHTFFVNTFLTKLTLLKLSWNNILVKGCLGSFLIIHYNADICLVLRTCKGRLPHRESGRGSSSSSLAPPTDRDTKPYIHTHIWSYLQSHTYKAIHKKAIFTKPCLQSRIYKAIFTKPNIQSHIYKAIFTKSYLESHIYKVISYITYWLTVIVSVWGTIECFNFVSVIINFEVS